MFINLHIGVPFGDQRPSSSESSLKDLPLGRIVSPPNKPITSKSPCLDCNAKQSQIDILLEEIRRQGVTIRQLRQILGRYPQI